MLIFLSFQTSAFGHDGENELERKKIFYGIENYDVITISQPGVLYYSVTNQIIKSVENLESKVTFIGRANIGLEKVVNTDGVETLSTMPNYLYNLSIKTIEGKYADLFYSDEVSELINEDKIIISDLTAKLYSINIGDILVLVGMNEETTELEVGDIIDFDNSNMFPETPMGFNNASWTSLNFVILEMKRAVGKVSVKARSV